MPPPESAKKLAWPYLSQARRPPVVVKTFFNKAALLEAFFNNVPLAFPLKKVYQGFPSLRKVIAKWNAKLEVNKEIITAIPLFKKALTQVEVMIQ